MFHRLIVPLDGSQRAEKAVPVAARIARPAHGSIVLTHVVTPGHIIGSYGAETAIAIPPTVFEEALSDATRYLATVKQTYAKDLRDIPVEIDTETGDASAIIASAASEEHGDLIVMCSHNDTVLKHWFLKHTTQHTIRHSALPVLSLNEHGEPLAERDTARPFHVLIPLDGSPFAEKVLAPTMQLLSALTLPAQYIVVHLMRVVDTSSVNGQLWSQMHIERETIKQACGEAEAYLKTIAQRIEHELLPSERVQVTTTVRINPNIPGTILQQAKLIITAPTFQGCDLIAMATHGRSGLQHFLQGSVTEHILGHTSYPLLVVHPHEDAQSPEEVKVGRQESKHALHSPVV